MYLREGSTRLCDQHYVADMTLSFRYMKHLLLRSDLLDAPRKAPSRNENQLNVMVMSLKQGGQYI